MWLKKVLKREKGQGLVEYALILVLIAIVVIAILALLGPSVGGVYSNIVCALENDGSISGVDVTPGLTGGARITVYVNGSVGSVTYTGTESGSLGCSGGQCSGRLSGEGGSIRITSSSGGCVVASW
jgi:pilus assembly protein Flp/PilA